MNEYVQSQELECCGCKAIQYSEKVTGILLRNKVWITQNKYTFVYPADHWLSENELEEYIRIHLNRTAKEKLCG